MNYKLLRREGSEADKQALLRKLRDVPQPKASWRVPAFATAFAMVLGVATAVGIFYTQAPIAAPEIDDLEFAGDSAIVIESDTDPATLIWLEDAEEAQPEEEDEEF